MTGEMSINDCTRESHPLHFVLADLVEGVVRPFDIYQGPFVSSKIGQLWLSQVADTNLVSIYNQTTDKTSPVFALDAILTQEHMSEAVNWVKSAKPQKFSIAKLSLLESSKQLLFHVDEGKKDDRMYAVPFVMITFASTINAIELGKRYRPPMYEIFIVNREKEKENDVLVVVQTDYLAQINIWTTPDRALVAETLSNNNTIFYQRLLSGTCYKLNTQDAVIKVLEAALKSQVKLRIYLGDTETGRDWHEEHDTIGRIGRSTGTIKIPLLVPDKDIGGPALLDHCIVKIKDTKSGQVLYQHKLYHTAAFTIGKANIPDFPEYKFAVARNGENCANFKTSKEAKKYVAFMIS